MENNPNRSMQDGAMRSPSARHLYDRRRRTFCEMPMPKYKRPVP
ncbi:MAG: hypothetical protein ACLRWQ_19035 [Flavonifractor plautii]